MIRLPKARAPMLSLGVASLVVGFVALLLFFLPVLGVPLGVAGFLLGVAGIVVALRGGEPRLRWAVFGIGLSALALGINLALALAPTEHHLERSRRELWQGEPDRPWVPPPARP